ncbi:MAG TPA: hypothetical protein VFD60_14040 [Nitrososphaeraceae archaeon]|jgi:hypothetical protein|nr:hypothetical protein [Nitrososphaeraceae archaeon]
MLGDLIYEHKGKVIGQRVLGNASEKGEAVVLPKVETTFSADAKLKGTIDITDTGTYLSIIRPGGILHGEGQGLYMAKDGTGETATWTGQGVGRLTEGGRVSYRGSLFFRANSTGKLSFLNNVVTVFEYEVDESGNTTAKMWEWK